MRSTRGVRALTLALALACGASLGAQVQTEVPPLVPGAKPVTAERVKIHGKALEGNLEGDAVDRDTIVFVPPGYAKDKSRRYPVVYALHGYSIGAEQWSGEIHVPQTIEGAFAQGGAKEMIVVLPDSKTAHNGSMYSSSVTTGDWETYVARDLVVYVDGHYRTIPERPSRGLAGASMGGYGAVRIAMKRPDVFSSLYILSACCLTAQLNPRPEAMAAAEAIRSREQAEKAERGPSVTLASAAAWSPNPNNPPLFLDLPMKDGKVRPEIVAKWAANSPLAMIDQYIPNLKTYRAIGMDIGTKDGLLGANKELELAMTRFGVVHTYEEYDGDHTNRRAERVETKVLPFFSNVLTFTASTRSSTSTRH